MRKVLLIAYLFPPLATSGAIRPLKFTKYLSHFGWEPVVLTVRKGTDFVIDPSLLAQVPKMTKVYRTRSWEVGDVREAKQAYDKAIYKEDSRIKKAFFTLLKYMYLNFLIPDSKIGWLPSAVIKGREIIRKEGIDVILTTGRPWTNFLIGYFLACFTNVPLVLDYRDPWTQRLEYQPKGIKRIKWFIEGWMERRALRRASRVITVSPLITARMQAIYPHRDRHKFLTLTNGFDPQDFPTVTPLLPIDSLAFTITYTGSFAGARVPDFFLQGLQIWLQDQPKMRTRTKVKFLGAMGEKHRQLIPAMGLQDVVEYCGQVEHREAIQAQVNSHLLLLVLDLEPDVGKEALTGKVFEYLAARRPILALVPPDGPAAHLIRETKTGIVVSPQDVQGIRTALDKMYRAYCEGAISYQPDDTAIAQYAYPNLAQRLADVLSCE